MLIVCATGCCSGRTNEGFAPVPTKLYHEEWSRRKLRNAVHLSIDGCLGPCQLANIALLLFDGVPIWFHSINTRETIVQTYDYIDMLLTANQIVAPAEPLASLVFNGVAWGQNPASAVAAHGGYREVIALDV